MMEIHGLARNARQYAAMYLWFRNSISLRGLLALAISGLFLWMTVDPSPFFAETPPVFVSSILLATGLALMLIALAGLRFKWRRARIVDAGHPVRVTATFHKDEDSDSTSYWAFVDLEGVIWRVGFDQTAGRYEGEFGKAVPVEVWLNPDNGEPMAMSVDGVQLNTLYKAYRV